MKYICKKQQYDLMVTEDTIFKLLFITGFSTNSNLMKVWKDFLQVQKQCLRNGCVSRSISHALISH